MVRLSFHLSPSTYWRATSPKTTLYFPRTLLLEFLQYLPGALNPWKVPKDRNGRHPVPRLLRVAVFFPRVTCVLSWAAPRPCPQSSLPACPRSVLSSPPTFQHRAQSFAVPPLNRSNCLLTSLSTVNQIALKCFSPRQKPKLKIVLFH